MRRALLAVVLVALALMSWAGTAPACGCGALVSNDADSSRRVDEWSLVSFDGHTETILMRLSLGAPLDRAALVLPVPRGARVTLGREAVFRRVSDLTAPRIKRRKRYHLGLGRGDSGGATAPEAIRDQPPDVRVVTSQKLGPLRVVTLRSRSADALEAWLRANRFALPGGLASGTQAYLDEGWDLVVAKLRPAVVGTPLTSVQPLAVRFRSARVVYPLRLSRLARAGSTARVDVFAPWKVDVSGYGPAVREQPGRGASPRGVSLLFAGPVSAAAAGGVPLPRTGPRSYVTSYRFRVDSSSPDRDPAFTPARDRRPYRQVRVEHDDVYVGGVLVGVGLVFVLAGALIWGLRRRARAA